MNQEVWKPVIGWEGLYEVSNQGRVLRRFRFRENGRGYRASSDLERNIMKGTINGNGYVQVGLKSGGPLKLARVHQLVATAFLSNPQQLPVVDHLNGIKTDNRMENLEWVTPSENTKRAWEKNTGKMGARRKVSSLDVRHIRTLKGNKKALLEISKTLKINVRTAMNISYGCARVND